MASWSFVVTPLLLCQSIRRCSTFMNSFTVTSPPPPTSTLFPYTTLFRSGGEPVAGLRPGRAVVPVDVDGGAADRGGGAGGARLEEHTSELQSRGHLVCRLLLVKKKIEMVL